MKKLVATFSLTLATLALAGLAWAGSALSGKVTKVDGEKVTVTVEGALPSWAKPGANVSALGGSPKVLAVQGNEVTLKFGKAKAAKIQVDSKMTITEAEDDMQGC